MHSKKLESAVTTTPLPSLMTKAEIAAELRRDPSSVDRLRIRDATFPKPLKDGTGRQSRVYFVRAEFSAWLQSQLENRRVA